MENSIRPLIVLCDIDNTILNTEQLIVDEYNRRYNKSITLDDVTCWNYFSDKVDVKVVEIDKLVGNLDEFIAGIIGAYNLLSLCGDSQDCVLCNRIDFFLVKIGICVADYLGYINLGNHFSHTLADDSLSDIFIRERGCNESVKVVFNDGLGLLVELR